MMQMGVMLRAATNLIMDPRHNARGAALVLFSMALLGQQTPLLEVTETGVGPITSNTAFSVSHLKELFPNFKVVTTKSSSEGIEFPTITVLDGQTELLEAGPTEDGSRVAGVVIKSSRVTYRGRGKIGSSYSEVFGDAVSDLCFGGKEELDGMVICRASSTSHITYLFGGDSGVSGGSVPAILILKTMRVKEVWWRARID
jgi:hypothetical protein